MIRLKKISLKFLKIIIILMMMFSCLTASINHLEAASYTGPFTRVKELDYPEWWARKLGVKQWSTWMCTFNGQWSYCLESSKNSPSAGEKTAEELVNSNEMVSKLLYYGFGGPAALPGELDGTGNGLFDDGLSTPETHYLYTHVLLSIAYSGDLMGVDLDGLESLGIGLKGLYNYIASLPAPQDPSLSDNFTAYFDPDIRMQKTNTVTFNATENATINVTLQDGVTLHNISTGKSGNGVVSVSGGQSFYLTAPMNVFEDYTSGNIAGNNCTRFVPLAIYGSGNTQSHGSYTYDIANLTYSVNWVDSGRLELTKTNLNQDLIDGAIFKLKATSFDGYEQEIKVTDGKITVENLPLGTYELSEIQAPEGYLLNETVYKIVINANETTTQTVSNDEPLGKITLTKEIDTSKTADKLGEAFIEGNEYGLYAKEKITNKAGTKVYYDQDELIVAKKTDQDGKITFDDLHLGEYYIKEISSNDSLVLNQDIINVSLKYANQSVSKVIVDSKTANRVNMQKIQIHKSGEKDGVSGFVKGLQGAEFTFKLKSEVDHVGWDKATTYAIITTDENGKANTPYLPYGKYLVKETKTPKDYITAPDFTVTISDDYSEYSDIEQIKIIDINNRPYTTQLKLIKRDQETNQIVTLNSAAFKIKAKEDIVLNGKVIYRADEIIKQKVGGQTYDTFTTNSENIVVSSAYLNHNNDLGSVILPLQLDPGKYYLEEVKVPDGFLALDKQVEFTIENIRDYSKDEDGDFILEINVTNSQPKGEFELTKEVVLKDSDTCLLKIDDLSPIIYQLTAKEDIISPIDGSIIYAKGAIVGKYNLNNEGYLKVEDLPLGQYQIQEIATIPGLVLDSKKYDVIFSQSDTTTKVYRQQLELENYPTFVEISKQDDKTHQELSGATLVIQDLDGNVIDEWVTNDKPHSITGLVAGKEYVLIEKQAPEGYHQADKINFIVDNTEKGQQIVMYDQKVTVVSTGDDRKIELFGLMMIVSSLLISGIYLHKRWLGE